MRLLTQKEWENPKYIQDNLPMSKVNDIYDEVFTYINNICTFKHCNHEIFGVAMTIFHYYSYYKSFKEFDRVEIAVACVFLAFKIEYSFIKIEEASDIFQKIRKSNKSTQVQIPNPDFIKFEIEILNFLGFEIDIETPYKYFIDYLKLYDIDLSRNNKLINLGFTIINDTFRRPFGIYFNSKYIALACLFYTLNIGLEKNIQLNELVEIVDKNINTNTLLACSDNLLKFNENRMIFFGK